MRVIDDVVRMHLHDDEIRTDLVDDLVEQEILLQRAPAAAAEGEKLEIGPVLRDALVVRLTGRNGLALGERVTDHEHFPSGCGGITEDAKAAAYGAVPDAAKPGHVAIDFGVGRRPPAELL